MRGGATSASLFITWLILFGYSLSTQARARRANRSAATASNFGGASAAMAAMGHNSRSEKRKDFIVLSNVEHRRKRSHRSTQIYTDEKADLSHLCLICVNLWLFRFLQASAGSYLKPASAEAGRAISD